MIWKVELEGSVWITEHSGSLTADMKAPYGPVIDVALWADVPTLNGVPHLVHHRVPARLLHQPNLRPVEHDVREHAACVVRHLDPVRLTVQQVTVTAGDTRGDQVFLFISNLFFICLWRCLSVKGTDNPFPVESECQSIKNGKKNECSCLRLWLIEVTRHV